MDYVLFVLLAPLAAIALVTVLVSVWRYRHIPAARLLLAAGVTIAGWLLFNTAEALATTPEDKLFWAKLTYLFIATAPLSWFAFTLVYTNRRAWLGWRQVVLLLCIPVLTIYFALTNGSHGLIWRAYSFYEISAPKLGPLPDTYLGIDVTHGPWFWLCAVYAYACLIASSVLVIHDHLRSFTLYRRRSAWTVFAVLAPLAANIFYLSSPIPGFEKDFTSIVFALSTGVFTVMIRKYGLLDLKPFARTLLIEMIRDSMFVLDTSDRIVDFNRQATEILALDDESIGIQVASALRAEHGELLTHLEGPHQEHSEFWLMVDTEWRYFELRVAPLEDSSGRVVGRLAVLYDMTLREEHEEALRQANLRLESECEELDAFARTVAHDLQNPVHTILGFSDILEQDYDHLPGETRRELTQTITRTAVKMQQIIHELLLLASVRRQPVQPQPFDMAQAVAEVRERLQPEIERRGAHVAVPDEWPEVLGYSPWIEEVWSNYLGNAIKYAGSEPDIELGYTVEDGGARFSVRDFGPGVPLDKQTQLFVPFSRIGQPSVKGHGLGLSIVRRIMEALGGGYGVESTGVPGEGSTFYFTLPLVGAEAVEGEVFGRGGMRE
ncbi:MAG TPA: histidine kinase N-terminal 7TM domain-containing protein [Rhodothermales bacterium]|nr:histidine kinase N-terminal 7TM domain-containing protein [Rhodothermales bacterium]